MQTLPLKSVEITAGFWHDRLSVNSTAALVHQWQQLEASGCIQNFALAAGQAEGFREGLFFADSDAYKWLEAAARTLAHGGSPWLQSRVDDFIALLAAAQEADGYLYTYNQLHFPGQRWQNLQLEHEFYCLGHLIEAGVSHFNATGSFQLLTIARKAADLLVATFLGAGPCQTDGHEEIEIALLRLHEATGDSRYRDLAGQLLERRGRIRGYAWHFLQQSLATTRRLKARDAQRAAYVRQHPQHHKPRMPSRLLRRVPAWLPLRLACSLLSGQYAQQNAPLRRQIRPVGHAVRFTYLAAAAARLVRLTGAPGPGESGTLPGNLPDTLPGTLSGSLPGSPPDTLPDVLAQAWEHMVTRRMYVTGGLGSLPLIEGFGRDYELDPELAYAETCAALGCLQWNWEMLLGTGEAKYADLFEWQLYNAAAVSMSQDGCAYFYDNPLTAPAGLARRPWYDVPCCPSNLSRLWAGLGTHLYSTAGDQIRVGQYISSRAALAPGISLELESGLPWTGRIRLQLALDTPRQLTLQLRRPSWAGEVQLRLNGAPLVVDQNSRGEPVPTGCGYSPQGAGWLASTRLWHHRDVLELDFSLPLRLLTQDRRLPGCGGLVALARGPLVYCLEQVDNPQLGRFPPEIKTGSLRAEVSPAHFGGITILRAETPAGEPLVFIPYLYWANRGSSPMTVFVKGSS